MTPFSVREALEACRPGTNDRDLPEMGPLREALQQDPELAELAVRVMKLDEQIGEALRNVPVPDGYADRVLSALRTAASRPDGLLGEDDGLDESQLPTEPADPRRQVVRPPRTDDARVSRRAINARWMVAAASLVVFLLIGAWQLRERSRQLTAQQLAEHVATWSDQVRRVPPAQWNTSARPPQDRRLPTWLASGSSLWRPHPTDLDREAVVYRLRSGRQSRWALCYVLDPKRSIADLPNALPARPDRSTGGWYVGSWQQDGYVYSLAVAGSESDYRAFAPRLAQAMQLRQSLLAVQPAIGSW